MKRSGAAIGCIGAVMTCSACGPEPIAQEELEEVCGQDGPFRILPLEPDRQLLFGWTERVGERLLFVTHRIAPGEEAGDLPRWSEPEVWSTGLCGESPALVASGVDNIFTLERWPGVVLGCDEATAEIVSLDPLGEREPHVVFAGDPEALGCALRWTDHGLLTVVPHDDDVGALVLSPYPDDPLTQTSEPEVLLDDVRITPSGESGTGIVADSIRTFPDFVLALDGAGTLFRADLADRSVTPLLDEVRSLEASHDGRWLLWQDSTLTRDDPEYPEGDIILRDLSTGTDALLAQTSLQYSAFPLMMATNGIVQLGLGYVDGEPKSRIFFLPGLDSVDVRPDLSLNAKIDDERWVGSLLFSSYYDLFDLRAGTSRRLFERPGRIRWFEEDGLVLFEAKQCCIDGTWSDEGPMWRVPYDGMPQQIAKRVTGYTRRLPDERLLGPVGIDDEWSADLIVTDPETLAERLVDHHVFATSLDVWWGEEDGLFSYSVRDGERSGVYVARLPPHARSGLRKATREHEAVDWVRGADGRPMPVPRLRSGTPDWAALAAVQSSAAK
ncbi:hypothetical protein [Nannocystis punicea]|uniref:Uncharacterized protein n=1 Tax=Nannocystis punicea TaxID=2995304 RepID=A0ABY7H409_9BACT|nr:hypothetical protein [Nannocystis poenicansa]WAS93989.1 hypothetical protein O0S08_48290 [Nannocystis poenicansa]